MYSFYLPFFFFFNCKEILQVVWKLELLLSWKQTAAQKEEVEK